MLVIAEQWKVADYLSVGDGERSKDKKLKSSSIAANAVESVIGAVFEDAGWDDAKALVLKAWAHSLGNVTQVNLRDTKSELQELTQASALGLPTYKLSDLGLNRSPRFFAECFLDEVKLGEGFGQRKKEAELQAAAKALQSTSLKQLTA